MFILGSVNQAMKPLDDIWEDVGSLAEEDLFHVITKLYEVYEGQLKKYPGDQEALNFFKNLSNVIAQVDQCNLNRR